MLRGECSRHPELLELAASGGWPERCDADLRQHLESCADCADLALVVCSIAGDRDEALPRLAVPPAGAMWWKAQRRAQLESAVKAERTVTTVQLLTIVTAVVALFGLLGSLVPSTSWKRWLVEPLLSMITSITLPHISLSIVIVIAAFVALAPIAVVIAIRE